MHAAHDDGPNNGAGVSRRGFLATAAGAAVAGAALASTTAGTGAAQAKPGKMVRRPNLILFITDQERKPMYWPKGWAKANLPNRQRLIDHGLSFENAFTAAAMCSPSRSTFFTGKFPAEHGVTNTLTEGGTVSPTERTLPVDEQNMAKLLRSAGYRVHYRGKWHLSKGSDGHSPSSADLARYGFDGWRAPDFGGDTSTANFGGGCADHDSTVTAQAVDFLRNQAHTSDAPFALIVSLANPHDILSYPKSWDRPEGDCDNYGSVAPQAFHQGISLPPSFAENLRRNHKPSAQVQSQVMLGAGLGVLPTRRAAHNYVNFYAYLHKVVDQQLGQVLDALEARPEVADRTLFLRISDHGEMGLSHGGLRQKAFNAYEETLRVPLIMSNRVMFPQATSTKALASLVDLMPTLASLAKVPNPKAWIFRGADLTPVIADAVAHPSAPSARVQDSVMFTFDDQNAATPNGQNIVKEPNHIRTVRDERWKYSVYFDPDGAVPAQRELYDLRRDPYELVNRADPRSGVDFDPAQMAVMEAKLYARMRETATTPRGGILR